MLASGASGESTLTLCTICGGVNKEIVLASPCVPAVDSDQKALDHRFVFDGDGNGSGFRQQPIALVVRDRNNPPAPRLPRRRHGRQRNMPAVAVKRISGKVGIVKIGCHAAQREKNLLARVKLADTNRGRKIVDI